VKTVRNLVDSTFDFAAKLLETQREFAHNLVAASTPPSDEKPRQRRRTSQLSVRGISGGRLRAARRGSTMHQPRNPQPDAFGTYLREQRRLADLSLRELASVTDLSNAYISQLERGLHQPSVRVLRSLASALNVSATTMLAHAGLTVKDESMETTPNTEAAIRADPRLSEDRKLALLAVYRTYVKEG
jgi:transcriptional regulator with XRE-family HTH domain